MKAEIPNNRLNTLVWRYLDTTYGDLRTQDESDRYTVGTKYYDDNNDWLFWHSSPRHNKEFVGDLRIVNKKVLVRLYQWFPFSRQDLRNMLGEWFSDRYGVTITEVS